jgi:NAD(P)H-dependent flavin oxidoreductase YrpB (nitropropane dioxygenase family)
MLGAVQIPPDALGPLLDDIRAAIPDGRFGVNFLMPFLDLDCLDQAARQADVVELFYDLPDPNLVRRIHDGGALASWQIGSREEAHAAIAAGCDFITAQGVEAGGHVRGTTPLLILLDQICKFATVPVLAAGGPATGSGLAAALAAGACGVRIGTRFLLANESVAHPQYVDALIRAAASDTTLTSAFSDGWPEAPHRVLQSCITAAEHHAGDAVGMVLIGGQSVDLPKFNVLPPDENAQGNIAAMCLYAGQSVESVDKREPASDIVREIVNGAENLLRGAALSISG